MALTPKVNFKFGGKLRRQSLLFQGHRNWKIFNFARNSGVKGFEPLYDGIKTRCLATWRYSIIFFDFGGIRWQASEAEPPKLAIESLRSLYHNGAFCFQDLKELNHRSLRGVGFEPTKKLSTDLQSVAFNHSAILSKIFL